MTKVITAGHCPGLGDIRAMGAGDTVFVQPDARERKDWGRVVSAIADAVSRGAGVEWGVF